MLFVPIKVSSITAFYVALIEFISEIFVFF